MTKVIKTGDMSSTHGANLDNWQAPLLFTQLTQWMGTRHMRYLEQWSNHKLEGLVS